MWQGMFEAGPAPDGHVMGSQHGEQMLRGARAASVSRRKVSCTLQVSRRQPSALYCTRDKVLTPTASVVIHIVFTRQVITRRRRSPDLVGR